MSEESAPRQQDVARTEEIVRELRSILRAAEVSVYAVGRPAATDLRKILAEKLREAEAALHELVQILRKA